MGRYFTSVGKIKMNINKFFSKKSKWFIFLFFLVFIIGNSRVRCEIRAKIARWYNNCSAAISLTHDHGQPASKLNRKINKFVVDNGLTMDYEIVTGNYIRFPVRRKHLLHKLTASGLSFYGHGHTHINHDKLSYNEALKSFKQCYKTMKDLGLKPTAYAYPHGAGMEKETRQALSEAGFLSGRLHFSKRSTDPYIVPGSTLEPEDWFALPTIVMQDYAFNQCKKCVNNNEELIPYLDNAIQKRAWIILTYHSIGNEKGYGFFKFEEFKKNIHSIRERDFWSASMNSVTLYTRERSRAKVKIEPVRNSIKKIQTIRITLSDGLPNEIYDQPLTILFNLPGSWINKSIALVENGKVLKTLVFDSINGMISIKPDEIKKELVVVNEI
jgi:hypothetical protein